MSATLPILNAFKARLNAHFPDWDCQLMPDDPSTYFLDHPNGAILISYAGSDFGEPRPSAAITQSRTLTILLTVMSRNLHNDFGAIELLDNLRLALVGFRPPNCSECYLKDEAFDEQESGIWVYQLVLKTQTMQVQQCEQAGDSKPKFASLVARQKGEPLDPRIKPKS